MDGFDSKLIFILSFLFFTQIVFIFHEKRNSLSHILVVCLLLFSERNLWFTSYFTGFMTCCFLFSLLDLQTFIETYVPIGNYDWQKSRC